MLTGAAAGGVISVVLLQLTGSILSFAAAVAGIMAGTIAGNMLDRARETVKGGRILDDGSEGE